MAINPQKLLPQSKGVASTLANFSGVSSGLSIRKKTTDVNRITQLSVKYNEQNVDVVRSSLVNIDALLKTVLTEDRNTTELKRRRKEREEFEERESNLEVPREQKKFRLPAVSLPGMSFLDRIKRFLLFTGIGWLFTNFQNQLPKLLGIIKIITPIYGVVENVFKFILSSVVSFIERGYEAYDKVRALVKNIGGEGAQQSFDALSTKLNEYINYILVGGLALTGAINAFASNVSKLKPQPQPQKPVTGTRPTVTRGAGGAPVRTGAARVTTSGGKLAQRQIAKNILRTTVKPALSRLPVVGALIEFGLSWALGDPVGKAAFRGIGSLIVGAVGTAIGGPIGAAIGGLLGGEIGGRLYDTFFGGQKPPAYRNGGRVIKAYAKGGGILGDYGLGRTLEVERSRRPAPPPQSTQPGRDVGGAKEIKKLFPNPNENILTYGKPNPFYALENTASDFKSAPYGLGSLMGAAIDVSLGQKLSNNTILNASVGLENMFYDNYDKDKNYIDVRSIIFGVVRSAADSALNNIQNQLSKGKGKKEEEKKEKPSDQTQSSQRDIQVPGGAPSGVDVSGAVVGYVGSTGRSSGPHIHIETGDGYSGKGGSIPKSVLDSIIVDGKTLSSYAQGDGIGAGRGHAGFDYAIRSGAPIVLKGGLKFVEYDEGYNAGYGNSLILSDSSGRKYLIGHLSGGPSDPGKIKELQDKQKTSSATKLDDTSGSKMSEPSAPVGAGNISNVQKQALNILSKYESASSGGYNAVNQIGVAGGRGVLGYAGDFRQMKQHKGKSLTDMTIAEIMALQAEKPGMSNDEWIKQGRLHAVGRYQFIGGTLPGVVARAGVPTSAKFTPEIQDKLALQYLKEAGIGAWVGPADKATKAEREIIEQARKAKKGGDISRISSSDNYIPKQPSKYNTQSIETYPDYADGGMRTRVAIQRIFVEKMVPIPMGGNKNVTFPVSVGVNNSMSLSQG